jgi:hypothetical protein
MRRSAATPSRRACARAWRTASAEKSTPVSRARRGRRSQARSRRGRRPRPPVRRREKSQRRHGLGDPVPAQQAGGQQVRRQAQMTLLDLIVDRRPGHVGALAQDAPGYLPASRLRTAAPSRPSYPATRVAGRGNRSMPCRLRCGPRCMSAPRVPEATPAQVPCSFCRIWVLLACRPAGPCSW